MLRNTSLSICTNWPSWAKSLQTRVKWCLAIEVADGPDPVQGLLVPDLRAERVAGVRGVGDQPAGTDDVHGLADGARLGVFGVHIEVSRHGTSLRPTAARPVQPARHRCLGRVPTGTGRGFGLCALLNMTAVKVCPKVCPAGPCLSRVRPSRWMRGGPAPFRAGMPAGEPSTSGAGHNMGTRRRCAPCIGLILLLQLGLAGCGPPGVQLFFRCSGGPGFHRSGYGDQRPDESGADWAGRVDRSGAY